METSNLKKRGKVLLASPRGFCAGVVRAVNIVNLALEKYGQPLFVRREIVHNRFVVNELVNKGIIFVHEVDEIPVGGRVIFSAHGVSPEVRAKAKERRLQVIDATCPLVTKVHNEAIRYAREGYAILMIGNEDHDEVIGTLGEAPASIRVINSNMDVAELQLDNPTKVAYLTQTTLSLDETRETIRGLREKFPLIRGPASEDICYATQNRQRAVLQLARRAEVILVVGSANSSNSRRLVEVSRSAGTPAHLIDDTESIDMAWLSGIQVVGLTAGASAPEDLVKSVVRYLNSVGYPDVEAVGDIEENVEFVLPAEFSR